MPTEKPKVFLCYAHADHDRVVFSIRQNQCSAVRIVVENAHNESESS